MTAQTDYRDEARTNLEDAALAFIRAGRRLAEAFNDVDLDDEDIPEALRPTQWPAHLAPPMSLDEWVEELFVVFFPDGIPQRKQA